MLEPVKLNRLFHDFGQAVETDFDLTGVPPAIKLAKEADIGGVRTFVLDPSSGLMYTPDAGLYGGAYVIIPKKGWSEVRIKIKEFLSNVAGASQWFIWSMAKIKLIHEGF